MVQTQEHPQYHLLQNGDIIATENEWDLREVIEQILEQETGYFISLQENTDGDVPYEYYAHSEAWDEMTEEDIEIIETRWGIITGDEIQQQAEKLFGLTVKPAF